MKTSLRLIGGKKIESPKSTNTRPTTLMVRQAIFNILNKNVENTNWLDLFSGSGAISCEAYNHGARRIVAIEKNRKNALLCQKNLFSLEDALIRKDDIKVICQDVFSWINIYSEILNKSDNENQETFKFDYIYIDPPYKKNFHQILLNKIFNSNIIKKQTTIIYENCKFDEIQDSKFWKVVDSRSYGQTKLSFLIKI